MSKLLVILSGEAGDPLDTIHREMHLSVIPGKPGFGSSGPEFLEQCVLHLFCILQDQTGRGPQV